LGHPYEFQRVSRLGSVTTRYSSSGRQPNFAALNRGRYLYSARRPSRWALSHILVTFRVSRRRREMYCGHARLCVCLSVCVSVCVSVCLFCLSAAACPHYCTDPDVTWGSGRGCPLVVHCWADMQSVHGLRCYDNTRNARHSPAVIRQAHRSPHAVPRTAHAGEDSPRQR